MASSSQSFGEDEMMDLPPGFRFHPTDEELVTHYLLLKVRDHNFTALAIGEADLNKVEPWDLPGMAKRGEKEWYFFCVRDRKYPGGTRTNRATGAGYWKATGKDKEVHREKALIGMKKTLVFYSGRAPKGEKTNWVMHEYRLEGKYANSNHTQDAQVDWVICRVFHKGKNPNEPQELANPEEVDQPVIQEPIVDQNSPIVNNQSGGFIMPFDRPPPPPPPPPPHVTCFSNLKMAAEVVQPALNPFPMQPNPEPFQAALNPFPMQPNTEPVQVGLSPLNSFPMQPNPEAVQAAVHPLPTKLNPEPLQAGLNPLNPRPMQLNPEPFQAEMSPLNPLLLQPNPEPAQEGLNPGPIQGNPELVGAASDSLPTQPTVTAEDEYLTWIVGADPRGFYDGDGFYGGGSGEMKVESLSSSCEIQPSSSDELFDRLFA